MFLARSYNLSYRFLQILQYQDSQKFYVEI